MFFLHVNLALRVAALYALFGGLWIFLSDRLLVALVANPQQLTAIQTYKGWGFVATSAILIYLLLHHDLRQRAQARQSLRKSQENYRLILEYAGLGIGYYTPEGVILLYNQTAAKYLGGKPEDFIGKSITEVFGEAADEYLQRIKFAANNEGSREYEDFVSLPAGDRWFLSNYTRVLEDPGSVVGVQIIAHDITKRRQAEKALRRTNRALKVLSECNQILVRAADESSLLVDICQTLIKIGNYRLAWVGLAEQDEAKTVRPAAQVGYETGYLDTVNITWADTERGQGPAGSAIRTGQPVIARNILADPHYAPWRAEATRRGYASSIALPLVGQERILGALNIYATEPDAFDVEEVKLLDELASNLTYGLVTLRTRAEHQRAEKALRRSEERFAKAFHANPLALLITTLGDGRIIDANRAYCTMMEYTREKIIGRQSIDLDLWVAPPDREQVMQTLTQTGLVRDHEVRFRTQSGRIRTALTSMEPIELNDEKCIISFALDITTRKQIEQALSESEARYRLLVEMSPDGIAVHQNGKLVFSNPAGARLLGAKQPDELVGKPITKVVHPDYWATAEDRIQRMLKGETGLYPVEACYLKLDGTAFPVEVMAAPFTYAGKPAIQVVVRDITERKQAEEQLQQSREQLRALASHLENAREAERTRLAREIHDEFGQALTALKIDLAWLAKRLPDDKPTLRDKIGVMSALLDTTIQTVRHVAAELRPGLLDDLGLLAALEWQAQEFNERTGIVCELNLGERTPAFDRDISTAVFRMFQETLTNVTRHAKASRVRVDMAEKPGQWVLTIRDNGRGITAKQLASPRSLGLIGMRERAREWGGEVTITGTPGQGTTVTIMMPQQEGHHD